MHVNESREALKGGAVLTEAPQILLIGGDPSPTTSTCEILESESCCVVHRTSGTEGLEAVSQYHPALVILYLALADRDGIAVCRTIHTQFPSAIVIVSPSHGEGTYPNSSLRSSPLADLKSTCLGVESRGMENGGS
jgi:CheY-like chemotaxis protein